VSVGYAGLRYYVDSCFKVTSLKSLPGPGHCRLHLQSPCRRLLQEYVCLTVVPGGIGQQLFTRRKPAIVHVFLRPGQLL
jgi:hypothetical protein